jgi:cell division protease FtsH
MNTNNEERDNGGKFTKILIVVIVIGFILAFIPSKSGQQPTQDLENINYTKFVQMIQDGKFKSVSEKEGYIYGYTEDPTDTNSPIFKAKMVTNRLGEDMDLKNAINTQKIPVESISHLPASSASSSGFNYSLLWWPVILIAIYWIFSSNRKRQVGGDNGDKVFSVGKTRVAEKGDAIPNVTFKDVAGIDEAKVELEEVVQFLKHPDKFKKIGAKIPKGVLLMGVPGTGKTLLAKAVAGEAGVPFFSISGSEFVEMFVGVGASRVRDLFGKARKAAPCIVFIDEIDAVGKKRGASQNGGNDEREQTLNQLLVEMDGFSNSETIILLAATNRPELLDGALTRPGRFDRQVVVDKPDLLGREAILKVHARNKKFTPDVDLHVIARETPGFVGADIANLLNEAAILAARAGREEIEMADLEEASEKVTIGPERKSRMALEKERIIVAHHEVGHALLQKLLPYTEPVHKVTIIPRGMAALGYTMSLPTEDRYLKSKNEYLSELVVLLGGRAAEEVAFGDITTGASNDIERATMIAYAMITRFGMDDKFGPLLLDNTQEGDMFQHKHYSDITGKEIDDEVKLMVNEAYSKAKKMLRENKDTFLKIAETLLKRETITGEELDILIKGEELPPLESSFSKNKIDSQPQTNI